MFSVRFVSSLHKCPHSFLLLHVGPSNPSYWHGCVMSSPPHPRLDVFSFAPEAPNPHSLPSDHHLNAHLLPFPAPQLHFPHFARCCGACRSTADPCTCAALSGAGGVGRTAGLLLTVAVGSKQATQSARYCSSHHGS